MFKIQSKGYAASTPSGAIVGDFGSMSAGTGILSGVKKWVLLFCALIAMLFSVDAFAGEPARNLDPGIAVPHSKAFGKTLDEWLGLHLTWLGNGQDPTYRVGNVAFLPIIGESPFVVSVEPGTPLVLPVVAYLFDPDADPPDPPLPDEWFGDTEHVFGEVSLDGVPVVEPNEAYYVGPTELDQPVFGYTHYQGIAFVITPLSTGQHEITLHAEFVDFGVEFDNIWLITVGN